SAAILVSGCAATRPGYGKPQYGTPEWNQELQREQDEARRALEVQPAAASAYDISIQKTYTAQTKDERFYVVILYEVRSGAEVSNLNHIVYLILRTSEGREVTSDLSGGLMVDYICKRERLTCSKAKAAEARAACMKLTPCDRG